jgi:hypothetical protein
LRELRDLGFSLTSERAADDDQYVLHSATPDLDYAARFLAAHNIQSDRTLSDAERSRLLRVLAESIAAQRSDVK